MSATDDAARDALRQVAGFRVPGSEATLGHGDTFHRRKGGAPLIVTPIRRAPSGTSASRKRRKG